MKKKSIDWATVLFNVLTVALMLSLIFAVKLIVEGNK